MKTFVQKLAKSQIEIKIEVPVEEFQDFIEKATLNLGKDLEVEGFRKGKASKEIIEKEIGQEKILQTAGENCIRENYIKAVKEQKLEPLGQPEVEILKLALGNPFEFKAKVSVLPEIELPDYRKIASQIERKKVLVTDEEIKKLKQEKEKTEREKVRSEILEKIVQKTEIEPPQVLIETEKARMLESLKQQVPQFLRISFEEYLKKINKTEEELSESFLPEAEKKVKNSLVLREIEKKENVEVLDEEIKEETDKILKNYSDTKDLDQGRLKEYAKEVIKNEKTLQLLENLTR